MAPARLLEPGEDVSDGRRRCKEIFIRCGRATIRNAKESG